jgi:hypothetical protein
MRIEKRNSSNSGEDEKGESRSRGKKEKKPFV